MFHRLQQNALKQHRSFTRPGRTENVSLHPSWLRNQLSVQDGLCECKDVSVAPPHFAFPFPRELRRLPTEKCVLHGARVHEFDKSIAESVAVCMWSGVWLDTFATEVLAKVLGAKAAAEEKRRGQSCAEVAEKDRQAPHGESCGASSSFGGEEEGFWLKVMVILHQQGFELFSQAGADVILAHKCVSEAIGFAGACRARPLMRMGVTPAAAAYGFVCLAGKMHWPQDTRANGLASLVHMRAWWGSALRIPPEKRLAVRSLCEKLALEGGFAP